MNGDGYDDLIIGARGAGPGGKDSAGETYVVYGGASAPGTGGVFDLSALDGMIGFTLTGIEPDDESGRSVSSAGDVNGDGYDDLIIGARSTDPNGARSGHAYVVYGGASAPGTDGVLALSALDGASGFTLNGIDPADVSGPSVSSAGDVNGDGYDDLIIGARGADPNGARSGKTHVVYGGASAPGTDAVLDLSALDGSSGFTLTGIDPGDVSGYSVSSAGDVNGDGYDDLIIGAHRAHPAGETYVVYGGANAPGTDGVLALSALDGTNGFTLTGINARDRSGHSVSSAGDVNGDGYDDLLIGAPGGSDPNGEGSGENYVVYGGATGTESIAPVTAQGAGSADNFTGNAGADRFTEIATGDVVRGGAGDDRISVTSVDFAHLDGGTGRDTLVLAGPDLSLDLTHASAAGADVASVEVLDLSGAGADTLVLDALAVFGLTEERDGGMATLDVRGDADDTLELRDGNFFFSSTETEAGSTYNVYRAGNAQVRVQDGVVVKFQASVAENTGAGSVVFTATAVVVGDPDGGALTYSLSGTDAALFTIDEDSGEVRFIMAPDFENPADDDRDNVHDVTVTVSDGDGNRTDHAVAIRVTDENDGPVFTSSGQASVVEGQGVASAVYTAMADDADGDTLTYGLSGTDADLFTINEDSGEVRFRAAPDYENPADDDGDNVHDVTVTASDGDGNRTGHEVAITVTDDTEDNPVAEVALSMLDGTNGFTLTGIDLNDYAGVAISSAGDVNGDGYDDLIIGARGAGQDGKADAGETHVVYGGASAPGTNGVLALSALDGTNGFTLTGIDPGDRFGVSVSSAGDVNGDGYDDLIIGAPGADPNGARGAGETYVVYGGATGTESTVPVTAQGTVSADNFTGNAGADTFTEIATGDVVRGGAGDDGISVTSLDFAHIDGGTGNDTLVLAGSGLSLDLMGAGTAGADTFTEIASGDVVRGGADDDSISVNSLDFAHLDGGTGRDTLVLDGPGLLLDLTGAGNAGVDSVEIFDLSGTGADRLVLDALAVFDLTEERDGGMAILDVLGDADDMVDLSVGNFIFDSTETEADTIYHVYRDGNAEVRVQDGVSVTLAASGLQSDLDRIQQEMEVFTSLVTKGDTEMDGS